MRGIRHDSGVARSVPARVSRAVAIGSLALLLGGIALGDAGCGGYDRCPFPYQEPSTPAARAVAQTVDAYVSAIAAHDPRRACAQIAPGVKRSVRAWQVNFDASSPWLRCGERAFFRAEEAGPLVSHRASDIDFYEGRKGPGLFRSGQAVASVEEDRRRAWVFRLERRSDGWWIVGIHRDDCEKVPG